MCRHNALKGIKSDVSPVHWQYGAIARLGKGETIDKYLENGYSTISLGYIGLYELTKLMKGVSHTNPALASVCMVHRQKAFATVSHVSTRSVSERLRMLPIRVTTLTPIMLMYARR